MKDKSLLVFINEIINELNDMSNKGQFLPWKISNIRDRIVEYEEQILDKSYRQGIKDRIAVTKISQSEISEEMREHLGLSTRDEVYSKNMKIRRY